MVARELIRMSNEKISLDQISVVDADSHIGETLDDLLPYISDEYSFAREMLTKTPSPKNQIFSIVSPTPAWSSLLNEDVAGYKPEITAGGETKKEEHHLLLDKFDIDCGIINSSLAYLANTIENPQFAVAITTAYNSWLLDTILDDNRRAKGLVTIAGQKPDIAAEEIDTYGSEDDIVGVQLNNAGLVPPAGHSRYDPIYEAAQRHDLPVLFHGGTIMYNNFPVVQMWSQTYAEQVAVIWPSLHIWTLTNLLFQGVPERFPELEFVFQEAGIAWVPYMKWRLDDIALEIPDEIPYLTQLPSAYIDDQFYFTTQPIGHTAHDPTHLHWAIEMTGPESVMYSADLPHQNFDPPEELFNRITGFFDGETVAGIMGGTAKTVFNLER